ncbi:ABC transporter substrate-binding protein [Pseudodesulfovibrio sp.]|nr:ABC transporter substrate-binding protein [Pseudodesulfovibrio sp.]
MLTNSMPPIKSMQGGKIHGIAGDVLITLLASADITIPTENMHLVPWKEVYARTRDNPGTIALAMARTPEREDLFKWVGPIYTTKLGLIGKKKRKLVIKKVEDLTKYRISTFIDSTMENLLIAANIPEDSLSRNTKVEHAIYQLALDEVDLLAFAKTPAFYLMQHEGLDPDEYAMVFEMRTVDLYLAFNKATDDELIRAFQMELDTLKKPDANGMSAFDSMLTKYFRPNY